MIDDFLSLANLELFGQRVLIYAKEKIHPRCHEWI